MKNYLYPFVAVLLIFIIAARMPLDSDLWWHLRAGETTLQMNKPITTDLFSYTQRGTQWVNHSWLSQVLLYFTFQHGGSLGLSALVALLAAVTMGVIYSLLSGSQLLNSFILLLGGFICSTVWSPRPQLASLFLLAITALLLSRYKFNNRKTLWELVPLFVFWSNLHGGYVLGLILIGCMILGEAVNKVIVNADNPLMTWKRISLLLLWGFLAYVATAINPNGIQMWLIPFRTIGVEGLQNIIVEWASPNFHEPLQQIFLLMFFLCVASFGLSGKRIDGTELLTFLVFGGLAFYARRNFGPFALVAIPILSHYSQSVLASIKRSWEDSNSQIWKRIEEYSKKMQSRNLSKRQQKVINLIIVAVLGLIAWVKLFSVSYPALVHAQLAGQFPAQAVAWIQENQPEKELFSEYNWGGYLTWALRDYPVYIDGRTDLYGDVLINEWLSIINADAGWENNLEKWGIRTMLVEPSRPIVKTALSQGWKIGFLDKKSIVLLPGR